MEMPLNWDVSEISLLLGDFSLLPFRIPQLTAHLKLQNLPVIVLRFASETCLKPCSRFQAVWHMIRLAVRFLHAFLVFLKLIGIKLSSAILFYGST